MATLNDLIPLSKAARMVPGGKPVSPVSVWRWTTSGLKTPDGRRVTLRAFKCGKRLCTTEAALMDFFRRAGGGDASSDATEEN